MSSTAAPFMKCTSVFVCRLLVLSLFFLFSSINRRQPHTAHIKHTHTTHTTLRLITPLTFYFYLQPNVSLWSDTWRMFAVHPPSASTLPERKQIIPTTTITSHSLFESLSHSYTSSLSLHLSLYLIAYLLIAFL